MKAVRIHKYGVPKAFTNENIPIAEPKVSESSVKIDAMDLNLFDICQRTASKAIASQLLISFISGSECRVRISTS